MRAPTPRQQEIIDYFDAETAGGAKTGQAARREAARIWGRYAHQTLNAYRREQIDPLPESEIGRYYLDHHRRS